MFAFIGLLAAGGVQAFDRNLDVQYVSVTNGMKWIDGRALPIEGRAFDDVEHYYDRLPSNVTAKVNAGVRYMKHHTAGMQFRFATDASKLRLRWTNYDKSVQLPHMPATAVSGLDVYRYDAAQGLWLHHATGQVKDAEKGGSIAFDWTPGETCLVNLPLYNGIREIALGLDPTNMVSAPPPRASGVTKPVVFYGTSITQGAAASRPGMSFVNIVGRRLDVPVVNLGFSGCGRMELEMSEHLARIDASCYVLDCLWNMSVPWRTDGKVEENYEPFIRNLRRLRPNVPIVMAERCDVRMNEKDARNDFIRALYDKLLKEGWTGLVYLPKSKMYVGDGEGTVEGVHPNDWGMMSLAGAFGEAVKKALKPMKWCEQ